MCNDMQVALESFMASWSPSSNPIWFGYFSPLKVTILGAKVTNTTDDAIYFNVDDDGRLWHVFSALDVWMSANVLTIQVVAQSENFGFDYSSSCTISKKAPSLLGLIINEKNRVLVEMVNIWSFFSIRLS